MQAQDPVERRFRLMEELDFAEKNKGDPTLSYGLDKPDDRDLKEWNAMIVGPMDTNFDCRFYSIKITTGDNYPKVAPAVNFGTKINLPFVNQGNGRVEPSKFAYLKNWTEKQHNLQGLLVTQKKEMMNNKKLPQPPEGEY